MSVISILGTLVLGTLVLGTLVLGSGKDPVGMESSIQEVSQF